MGSTSADLVARADLLDALAEGVVENADPSFSPLSLRTSIARFGAAGTTK
jgi:hypothetical protein